MKPEQAAAHMQEYAEQLALSMLADMDEEECIVMVRDFCRVMLDWQPTIREHIDDPVMLGLSCLTTAKLFGLAFEQAYEYTEKKVEAMSAIQKALNNNMFDE